MPLHDDDDKLALRPQSFATIANRSAGKPYFLIFYASGSPPWCPDVRAAQLAIEKVFGQSERDGYVVRVGDRETWKDQNNKWRINFKLTSIPSILKFENGDEAGRLVLEECGDEDTLKKFLS